MVVCKYYRQGHCRFGQYCQFEHVNTFGSDTKVDSYNEDEYTAVVVAKEVLNAERGGQWLLSCFAPLKERPCIPGMEDLSPEEVRWEMYEAQKKGMVEQAKVRFQQLCQDMKAKRDALKNPTRETITLLKEILGTIQKGRLTTGGNTAAKPSNFAFATPQLGLPSNTSASSVFRNQTFGTQSNPFSGGFTSSTSTSIFGTPNTTNPVFGGTPNFGSSLGGFGSGTSTSSVFGGTTNTSTFNTGQTTQAFGSSSSIFGGGTPQSVFGQPSVFGASNQAKNVFARPQTSQTPTSVFNSGTTSSSSLFNSNTSSQPSTSIFGGGANTTAANPFGGSSTLQTTNPLFGTPASSGSFSSGIFSQLKTVPAFGGAPVFGGGANFQNTTEPMFGEQPAFGGSNNIFGGANTATPTFSSAAQPTNAFGATVSTPNVNIFGGTQSTPSSIISTPNVSPFGTATTTTSSPFAPATSQFEATSTTASPFSKPSFGISTGTTAETFGTTVTATSSPFSTTVTSSSSPFGTTVTSSSTPFGIPSTDAPFGTPSTTSSPFATPSFADVKSSPFASTQTTVTTTTTNPFAPRIQQTISPFGNFVQSQTVAATTVSPSEPFRNSPFGSTMTEVVDESIFSMDNQLTDDEKGMYLAEKFSFGKIPLKPPTKEMR